MALLTAARRPRASIRLGLAALGLVLTVPLRGQAPAGPQATDSVLEYRVKAAYLLNFTRYVEWPAEAYRSRSSPLVLCVYGVDPFGEMLAETVHGRKVQNRPIELRRIEPKAGAKTETKAEARRCHLLFVSDAEWRRRPELLAELAGSGTLTVGEGESFAEAGGVLALVIEDQTVRFAVNLAAGDKAGLKLSSRMLSLASRIYGQKAAGTP